jgi:hypothetical protein
MTRMTTTKEVFVTDSTLDPWESEDPDELPDAPALLSYWRTANRSEAAQQELVADRWRLWRLARDMADALDRASTGGTVPDCGPNGHGPHPGPCGCACACDGSSAPGGASGDD